MYWALPENFTTRPVAHILPTTSLTIIRIMWRCLTIKTAAEPGGHTSCYDLLLYNLIMQ